MSRGYDLKLIVRETGLADLVRAYQHQEKYLIQGLCCHKWMCLVVTLMAECDIMCSDNGGKRL